MKKLVLVGLLALGSLSVSAAPAEQFKACERSIKVAGVLSDYTIQNIFNLCMSRERNVEVVKACGKSISTMRVLSDYAMKSIFTECFDVEDANIVLECGNSVAESGVISDSMMVMLFKQCIK